MSDFVAAVNHPLRIQILAILGAREASPVQLSRELDEEKGVVAYHCRKLEDLGLAEIVRERPVRGAVEHFFKATERAWFDEEEWSRLDPSVRSIASAWTLDELVRDAGTALNAGTFDLRGDRHLSRVPITLDEKGWEKVNAILDETLDSLLQEQAEATERMAQVDDEPIQAVVAMVSFEMPTVSRDSDIDEDDDARG
jgi:DNA-binding transcriptional ArsR family regulator